MTPALLDPQTSPLPAVLENLGAFVQAALVCDDLADVADRYDQAQAVAEYLTRKNHAREGNTALRLLEVRIGELLGPAEPGRRTDLEPVQSIEQVIRPQYRTAFRQMAAHADTVYQLINTAENPTRKYVLKHLGRDKRATDHQTWQNTDHANTDNQPTEYACIVIDPPWRYDNTATRGAAEDHYPTMALDELAALTIPAADNAHIYLWVTNAFIRDGFDLLDAWQFTYKATLTWCKPQIGMGNYFRNSTEHVLFGIRGKLPTLANNVPTWFIADRTKHSAKPESFYDLVERSSPGPHIEMFARRRRFGWHTWGNEA